MIFPVWFLLVNLVACASIGSDGFRLTKKSLQWDYANEKIRGVNLGGWFVLEPYITPSLFDPWSNGLDDSNTPKDEYHYCQTLGAEEAKSRLEAHWSSWYTEADFAQMKSVGINLVRIPIGYWAFKKYDYDPYVDGQQEYLDQALDWCRSNGIKAWIDLHGAPGSQNGFDNSGLRDSLEFQSNSYNTALTLDVLKIIADKYAGSDYEDVVVGIELLNEPLGPSLDMDALKDFFTQGYGMVRSNGDQAVIIHDAFQPSGYWDSFLTPSSENWNIVIDHHHYQVFSGGELGRSIDEHIQVACQWGWDSKNDGHWNLCGEWSAALTDCAKWLNGVGRGARWSGDYDGVSRIGSCDAYTSINNWTDDHKTNTIKYIEAQLDAYDQGAGWIFWCWKTEDAIDWDLQRLISNGIFPSPFDQRRFPNQCNF